MALWQARLVLQETNLLWDVLVVEATPDPSTDYWSRLSHWTRAWPFGSGHKVRLARCLNHHPWLFAAGKFATWRSYRHMLAVDIHSVIAPDAMQRLADSDLPMTGGPGCVFLRDELRTQPELIEEALQCQ